MAVTADELLRAGKLLREGGLVAFPTETVYGLGANALDADAVRKIYATKGRPATSPLIVHVDGIEMAKSLAAEWPEKATRLAEAFWPGPLTLVVPKRAHVPDVVTAGLPTVGIRVPSHPVALELIREAGVPIAAPSANPFTQLSPTKAEHVRAAFGDTVGMILDGGPTTVGIESTVLSLALDPPALLRPGMISTAAIEQCIGSITIGTNAGSGPHSSPGLHREHYKPRTPLIIGDPPQGTKSIYLYREQPCPGATENVRMPMEPGAYAAVLYDTLHRADAGGWEWIAVEEVPQEVHWAGVADRLRRAAQQTRPGTARG